jgi:hypothetical protein
MPSKLIESLAAELERPRELSPRVLNYIGGSYGVDHDAIGAFLANEVPKLEEDEIDLILSPVFTPKLADQAVLADLLGRESVQLETFPHLVQELLRRPTVAHLVTPDGQTHAVPLREVTIERYVRRLRLEGTISDLVLHLIEQVSPATDHPMLKAIARRAVWESAGAAQILVRYFNSVIQRDIYSLADTLDLLDLVEGRKPADLADLLARMPGWQEALRKQVEVGGGRPFFHNDIQAMHGGSRDQRQGDERLSAKERELDFLKRLEKIL